MRRKLLLGATLAVALLSLATLAPIVAPRACGAEHLASLCKPGTCSACRGWIGSCSEAYCRRCAAVRDCCPVCGGPLRSGLESWVAGVFGR
jgi:hypothetical protein